MPQSLLRCLSTTFPFFVYLYFIYFSFLVKQNPALILTLEESHLTLEGRDLPTKRKS
jgi:hypothetical protein